MGSIEDKVELITEDALSIGLCCDITRKYSDKRSEQKW